MTSPPKLHLSLEIPIGVVQLWQSAWETAKSPMESGDLPTKMGIQRVKNDRNGALTNKIGNSTTNKWRFHQ
jgi:hypothetical protein